MSEIYSKTNSFLKKILPTKTYNFLIGKWDKESLKKYLANTGWNFAGKLFSLAGGFVATALIARYLGPEEFGVLGYALSFAGFFAFFSQLGLDDIVYRELAQKENKESEILGSAIMLRVVGGLIATLAVVVLTTIFVENSFIRLLIVILSLPQALKGFLLVQFVFQAQVKAKYTSRASILVITTLTLLKLAVVFFDQGLVALIAIFTIEPILYGGAFVFIYAKKFGNPFAWRPNFSLMKDLLRDSFPLILMGMFAAIYSRIDQIMLESFLDFKAVGLYAAAVRIAEVWYFIPGTIIASLFPAIILAQKNHEIDYKKKLKKLGILLAGISVTLALVTSTLSRPLMHIVYGQEYVHGFLALVLYSWSLIGVSMTLFLEKILIIEKRTRGILFVSIGTVLLNVGLNILLIPLYGINGAALATFISYSLGPLFLFLSSKNRSILKSIIRV
jgi:PST family polysaccharide transporter